MKLLIDHMGYPHLDEGPEPWQPILDLARHDNVHVKISDVKGRSKQEFPFADMHGFVRALVDGFGAERCLWGTGYPGHHRTKHNWLSLADELRLVREGFDFLSDSQRDRILGGTAAEVWGLA
jgi:L-fuconolactonase